MNADDGGRGEDGRHDLRRFLWQWPEPVAPPEIEEDLRRAFRRRRARRPTVWWLPLAAGLTLLLAWQIHRVGRPVSPIPTGQRPLVSATAKPPSIPSDPIRPGPEVVAPPSLPRPRVSPSPEVPAEPEVVVEPGQAELLVAFARTGPGVIEVGSGAAIPRAEGLSMGAAVAPNLAMPEIGAVGYHTEWRARTDEWPLVQRSVPYSGR